MNTIFQLKSIWSINKLLIINYNALRFMFKYGIRFLLK
jgi:hypothetical protein